MHRDGALAAEAQAWTGAGTAFIRVTVELTEGSTPREEGAGMLVAACDLAGTIGGGRMEWDAIAVARAMLDTGETDHRTIVHLGPAIGQCCGGRVTLRFDRPDAAAVSTMAREAAQAASGRPQVFIYGAGHVGRALARALESLPFAVTLIDEREDELARTGTEHVALVCTEAAIGIAEQAPQGSAHVVMTHSHALDSLIAAALMEHGRFSYLGIIGSRSKRNSFRHAFRKLGFAPETIGRVTCPIGGSRVKDKRPEVIAALAAAEITTALLAAD